jgi:hypothetical protein
MPAWLSLKTHGLILRATCEQSHSLPVLIGLRLSKQNSHLKCLACVLFCLEKINAAISPAVQMPLHLLSLCKSRVEAGWLLYSNSKPNSLSDIKVILLLKHYYSSLHQQSLWWKTGSLNFTMSVKHISPCEIYLYFCILNFLLLER